MDTALFETLLRLGDNDLVLGQRLSELCGHGPALEEDIAQTNVALDLIGQAQYWLGYAGEVEGAGRDADALAYRRDAQEFHNFVLLEQPNGDYGQTVVRQFYYDAWHFLVLRTLTDSADERIAGIAEKSLKEVRYHLQRSGDWVVRLGDGTDESHARAQAAVDGLWPFVGELFEPADAELLERGVAADAGALRQPWLDHVQAVFAEATLTLPEAPWARSGVKRGQHSEHLGFLLAEMQTLHRAHPGASW
ncbi:MAG: phenylacetate-CoA oxygenase subunit PaaC [Salinisphaera sp.]|nr:phenylacetate-CoA oxygenase subunit PaaC [Salinisphaera sp.]